MPEHIRLEHNPAGHSGFFDSLSGLAGAIYDFLQVRLRLFGIESKEAALHFGVIVVLLVGGLFLACFGYVLLMFALAFALSALTGLDWVWLTLILGLLHLAAAAALAFLAIQRWKRPLFPGTVNVLKEDSQWLHKNAPQTKPL